MQILTVHNRYLIRGGEDESREAEARLLQAKGHQVDVYEENNDRVAALGKLRVALRTTWSGESYQNLKRQLKTSPYDLVHVQNFFPLISPSVHYAAQDLGVPVVQSLRNYRLICANSAFFRDGKVCEDCLGKFIPWPGVVHGCYRGSRVGTVAVTSMITVHRVMKTWERMVDLYIALTHFSRQKLIQGGFPADKIVVKPNFVYPDPGVGAGSGNYALFVGRLSPEKGIETLLQAWQLLGQPLSLKIVGEGPISDTVTRAAASSDQIEWLGRRPLAEVYDLIGEAKLLIFPSEWYETFGRVAVEAFAKGTPVIAANIGAIAELVDHNHTGRLFQPGNPEDLAGHIDWALSHPQELTQMRHSARAEFEAKYTAEENYRQLMAIYQRVIDNRK